MARLILLPLLLSLLTLPVPVGAQESELPAVRFGLVGLARLQTARLNTVPPNPIRPACHVSLQFLNEQGEPFREHGDPPDQPGGDRGERALTVRPAAEQRVHHGFQHGRGRERPKARVSVDRGHSES